MKKLIFGMAAALAALIVLTKCTPDTAAATAGVPPVFSDGTPEPLPPAECARRDFNGETPCSEAEAAAEAAEWNAYYGCNPNGCGFIDFEARPELVGGAAVYEPTAE